MIILTNIEDEVIILKKVENKKEAVTEADAGVIDVDYSLIRYLGNHFSLTEAVLNNVGYSIIKREDNTHTTLHRFILEYYSKYDEKLKQILEDKCYEVNHKNRDKLDNRLSNLEIVTHQNNIKHSKGLEYEVIFSSKELEKIQQKNLKDKQQAIDKEYLKRVSALFYKSMESNVISDKMLNCCYLKFIYNKVVTMTSPIKSSYNCVSQLSHLPKILPNFHTSFTKLLLNQHKQFIYKSVVKGNIALLKRYIYRYPSIREVLKKYNLMDKDSPFANLLLDLYEYVYRSDKYVIRDGNILSTISIKSCFNVVGKNKSFIILYLLGILRRQKSVTNLTDKKYAHIPSSIWIVNLKDEDFSQINMKAKKILDLKWDSVRYLMIAEEFGIEIADGIYSYNKRCKNNYQYGIRAKKDIINLFKKDQVVFLEGFITKQRIFDYVKSLNAYRQQYGVNYSKITNKFYSFISSLLLYNTEVKQVLEEKGLIYTTLNKKIINNITQHQKRNDINNTTHILKPNMKAIVLKSLISQ